MSESISPRFKRSQDLEEARRNKCMTRVLVVNGSPNMEKGNTERVLRPFLEGLKEGGAEVDVIYPKRLNIMPCTGELHCWDAKPGECIIKDDMQSIYPLVERADILVLATPVYVPLPGEMQNFINRLVSIIDPVLTTRKGRTRARTRRGVSIRKVALVSTGGWYEKGNFDTVVMIAKELAENLSIEYSGALLRPHAHALQNGGPKVEGVFQAAKECGRELATSGRMSKQLLDAVSRPLLNRRALQQG
jgi:multimeric flavodoxin WrbA